ncbi:uncharacterized protein [Amphiura filiformis]|uniref:uncharacterized protein isoform X2 n=1 Tax=Amphiura filiformis TaxID=82378 RepID=UPI003B2207D7
MDHIQQAQVQDLAEAWVAANNTNTQLTQSQYNRTQVESEVDESENTEDAPAPMKAGPHGDSGMPSTSPPEAHHHHYDNPIPMDPDLSEELCHTSNVKSQLAAALVARGTLDIAALTSSRKRKQSSPQPCREVLEAARLGLGVAGEAGEPGLSKVAKPGPSTSSQLDTKNSKMLPVHCIVEPLDLPGRKDQPRTPTEGYAIVPSTLLLKELVRVALSKLEFPMEHVHNATGVFQIRNWKPLPFNVITDNHQATVGQILGDLLSHITLKIKILPSETSVLAPEWTDGLVRTTIIMLLKDLSQSQLSAISPLSQSMISNIANSKYKALISEDKCREFGKWYQQFQMQKLNYPELNSNPIPQKLTFHPQHEVPVLREWFSTHSYPSEYQYEQFCALINTSAVRLERGRPVEVIHLKNWWKNERQKGKRQLVMSIQSAETSSS